MRVWLAVAMLVVGCGTSTGSSTGTGGDDDSTGQPDVVEGTDADEQDVEPESDVAATDVEDPEDPGATDGDDTLPDPDPGTDEPDTGEEPDEPDTGEEPDEGPEPECGVDPLAITGELQVGGTVVSLEGVEVEVTHRQNPDALDEQCVTEVVLTFVAGPDCTLTIEARDQLGPTGDLVIQKVVFEAAESCGVPAGASGTWTGGTAVDYLVLGKANVPAEDSDEICYATYFVVNLLEPLVSDAGDSLSVTGTSIQVSGEVTSEGDAEATCPAEWIAPVGDKIGCSDGTREGFTSVGKYPKIAACGGAWDVPGIHEIEPSCDQEAGNDGANVDGAGCGVADLCADGWHVCLGKDDVLSRNPLGCGGIMDGAQSPAFFLARTSSVGAFDCSPDSTTFGDPGTSNDLFGCGDLGCSTKSQKTLGKCAGENKGCDPLAACEGCDEGKCSDGSDCEPGTCFPLTLGSHDLCKTLKVMPNCTCETLPDGEVDCEPNSGGCGWCKPVNYWNQKLGLSLVSVWDCGSSGSNEANNVKKTDPGQGGVMCCADDAGEPEP